MPNHIHGIIEIKHDSRDAINRVSTGGITGKNNPMTSKYSLSKIIRWYKGRCTFEIRNHHKPKFDWQPRFWDHIIKNDTSYENIISYIRSYPKNWERDQIILDEDKQFITSLKKG